MAWGSLAHPEPSGTPGNDWAPRIPEGELSASSSGGTNVSPWLSTTRSVPSRLLALSGASVGEPAGATPTLSICGLACSGSGSGSENPTWKNAKKKKHKSQRMTEGPTAHSGMSDGPWRASLSTTTPALSPFPCPPRPCSTASAMSSSSVAPAQPSLHLRPPRPSEQRSASYAFHPRPHPLELEPSAAAPESEASSASSSPVRCRAYPSQSRRSLSAPLQGRVLTACTTRTPRPRDGSL